MSESERTPMSCAEVLRKVMAVLDGGGWTVDEGASWMEGDRLSVVLHMCPDGR